MKGDAYEKWAKAEGMHDGQLLSIRTGMKVSLSTLFNIMLFNIH